ncbi:FAD-dependent oxidoreductase [Nonomuraea sp. NN258]|uniref:NAD(P)/FAD-dependent oxidoreductase n=1 Tax=Nonomuraea antri TaxID=2730852 RepID=UPI00156A15C9|nr:FAD-dependent oxidoreductase [Nonomuraea antri]NRQ36874.1 FAD-dependent oxidoreductase [Nonomuraea antri]
MARIAIVGSGFGGYTCARHLERMLRPDEAEIVMIAPRDYTLYVPLLPQVAAGMLQPRSIVAPLHRKLRRTKLLPGAAQSVDLATRTCEVRKLCGDVVRVPFDVIVLAPGSMTRTFDIPGLDEYARGLKTMAEAVFLRDHVIAQLELAASTSDPAERAARCGFLVVGGGYSGTETAALLQLVTKKAIARFPDLDPGLLRWTLIDVAHTLMPELGERLGENTRRVLMDRGVDIRLGVTVEQVTRESARLTDGTTVPTRTLIWTAGVTPRPVVSSLGTETHKGRLVVGADLQVPGHEGIIALGDAAAVPDLTKEPVTACAPTAQHAHRQAAVAARNAVAALRGGRAVTYRHHDLGMVVDLGGSQAAARPFGLDLTGPLAQLVTRGYHLLTVPSGRAKVRVSGDWLLHTLTGDDLIRLDFLKDAPATLAHLEHV